MAIRKSTAMILTFLFIIIAVGNAIAVAADGTEEKNLVFGLTYKVETGEPVEFSHLNYEPETYNIDNGQLTNGITAMTDYNSSAWYRSMRGVSRIITFDLGVVKAVSSFSASFLHIKSMAIYAPRYVNVLLSEDGVTYDTVCRAAPDFDISDTATRRAEISAAFDNIYKARYVKVVFCSDIFTFCDEISIFGLDTLTGNEKAIVIDPEIEESGYLTHLKGNSDIIKIYNGYYPTQNIADNTAEELLPYIAYLRSDGSYKDTMFDSLVFVPCHTDYPSGGRLVKTNGKQGAVMSDWLLYLENTFAEGINTDALNDVVGEVYSSLDKKGKFTVYFTLPFPTVVEGAFGDIDNDGKEEYCTTLKERFDILKWYIDLTYETFSDGEYKNLSFGGFYWYREEVNYSETDHEVELVKKAASYLTKRGFDFLFDPFFLSTGFDHWKDLGFNAAVMQPNLVFSDYYKTEMLGEFASIIKKYNLGVEMETAEPGSFTDANYEKYGLIYENYLYYGWLTEFMDALHTFYQGAGPGTLYEFCHASSTTAKGAYLRSLYDKTYKFIKGTFTAFAPIISIPDFQTTTGQKNARISMTITDPDSTVADFIVEFTKKPEHGTVLALADNKSIVYTAEEGYSGTDSFEVRVFDKFSYSEPITVNVTIVDTTATESSEEVFDDSSIENIPKEKTNAIFVVLIIISVVVIIGVIAVLYIRSKKK
ncbi:MAG: hypothetical protein A2Y15_06620 [Clostridiales bacterium GWF2_36_10]|nr:MAG: hypothetical protein A2Y15_06620 [Clostridiales bacterium GWF2_36_10]HAN21241.1 hypothetical protein [Clostridiales bacterium]